MSNRDETHPHIVKKKTMVRDRIGCGKTSTYDLPAGDHEYGYKRPSDLEGAGDIISNWVVATPSVMTKSKYMTVYQNILAIKNGCVTAKSMREFGQEHPTIRLKESLGDKSSRTGNAHEGPFGMASTQMEVSMDDLIQAKYTTFNGDDADYPDVSTIEKSSVFPKPRPTHASDLQKQLRDTARAAEEPSHFTMKRFQNIQGTFSTQPSSPYKTNSTTSSPLSSPLKSAGMSSLK